MYTCEHFGIEELVYPELVQMYQGREWLLWHALDDRILRTADMLREFLGCSVTVNDCPWGGTYHESGLRPFDTTTGSQLSQHKFGRALDLKFWENGWTPEKLREHMKAIGCFEPGFLDRVDTEAYPFLLITRIEWMDNMGWFHFDVSTLGNDDRSIKIVGG